jgi:carbonic anhydrase
MNIKNNSIIYTLLIFTVLFFFSCSNNTNEKENNNETTKNHQKDTTHSTEKKDHWSYAGDTGPEYWSEIIHGSQCNGKAQSPIDFSGDMLDKDYVALNLDYKLDSILDITNNGHTVQVNIPWGKFNYNGKEYNLVQFHFHSHSEHSLNGEYFPLEAHLVHVTADNEIAVIGIWYKEGAENPVLAKIYDKVPEKAGETVHSVITIDLNNMLPVDHSYYHYVGSLTTPPCTEGVEWFVMKTPREASKEQIEKIKNAMPANNYRPVQPKNDRVIEDY